MSHAAAAQIRLRRAMMGSRPPPRRRRRPLPAQAQPNAIRLSYLHAMMPILGRARELIDLRLVKRLPHLVGIAAEVHDVIDPSDYPAEIRRALNEVADEFFGEWPPQRLAQLARHFAARTSLQQRAELAKQIEQGLSIDLWAEPDLGPKLNAWASENAELITSVPEKYFGEVKAATLQGLRTGKRAEDIAEDLQRRFDISENRAALIARDQVGKLHAEVNQARQTELGVEAYTWRGVMDERERPEHMEREGKRFSWDDPPSGGHPGEDINCRCGAEPVLDGLLENL